MSPAPNQVYSAFSFIGFVLCTIPFYWHLEGTWVYLRDSSTVFKKIHGDSLEHGDLHVHDLDRGWMLDAMYQFDRVERKHNQQGSGLL